MVCKNSRLFLEDAIQTVRVPCAEDLVIILGYGPGGEDSKREMEG